MVEPNTKKVSSLITVAFLILSFSSLALSLQQQQQRRVREQHTCAFNPVGLLSPLPPPVFRSCLPPYDDETFRILGISDLWPFAAQPQCIRLPNSLDSGNSRVDMDVTAQYEKQNPVKVCLYTTGTTGFRGWTSHGVSIISFPHVASALAQTFSSNPKDAWADYRRWEIVPGPTKMAVRKRREIVGDEQRTLRRDKEWSRGGRKEQEEYIVPYEILELPGKGMGCVARRLIRKGEVIARGWPALLLHAQLSFIPEREDLIDMAVEELGPNMRERIMKLSGGERGGKIEHVLRSNVFGVEVGGESHIALFPELSRFNHACRPNAFTKFSPETLIKEVVAKQDIPVGVEITISYAKEGSTTSDRLAHLYRVHGFRCDCVLCSRALPDATNKEKNELELSDVRRRRLRDIRSALLEDSEAMATGDVRILQNVVWPDEKYENEELREFNLEEDHEKADEKENLTTTLTVTFTTTRTLVPTGSFSSLSHSSVQDQVKEGEIFSCTSFPSVIATTTGFLVPRLTPSEKISHYAAEIASILAAEHLEVQAGYYYEFLARASIRNNVNDEEGAREFALRARDAWLTWESEDDPHVADAEAFVRNIDNRRMAREKKGS